MLFTISPLERPLAAAGAMAYSGVKVELALSPDAYYF
jgi:hypothetical protein